MSSVFTQLYLGQTPCSSFMPLRTSNPIHAQSASCGTCDHSPPLVPPIKSGMKTLHSSNEGSVIRVRRTHSASSSDYITAQAAQPGILCSIQSHRWWVEWVLYPPNPSQPLSIYMGTLTPHMGQGFWWVRVRVQKKNPGVIWAIH